MNRLPAHHDADAHVVDIHIGQRIRLVRRDRGVSQDELAKACGITFQQVQKYENAVNRVSGSRLYEIAAYLGVPIMAFYEGLPDPSPGVDAKSLPQPVDPAVDALLQAIPELRGLASMPTDTVRSVRNIVRSVVSAVDRKAA